MNIYENISSEFFLECELFPVNIAQEIKTHVLWTIIFFAKIAPCMPSDPLTHSRTYAQLGTAPVVRY